MFDPVYLIYILSQWILPSFDRMIAILVRLADVIAVPLFLLAFIYFWGIPHKTTTEWILLIFSAGGFLLDLVFTLSFLNVF